MSISTLTSKGQTTIPKDIRRFMKVSAGDRIDFIIKENGEVLLKPAMTDVGELRGLLKLFRKNSVVSVEEMNRAVRNRLGRNP